MFLKDQKTEQSQALWHLPTSPRELGQLSYGFMCLRTIEMLIRTKLHPTLTSADLANLEEHSKARVESDAALLTFG